MTNTTAISSRYKHGRWGGQGQPQCQSSNERGSSGGTEMLNLEGGHVEEASQCITATGLCATRGWEVPVDANESGLAKDKDKDKEDCVTG
eukprot:2014295-Ditylum_brightwellii.AAC.1